MKEIKEGDLYKSLTIEGNTFNIIYGYYSQSERELWGPTPIYPDFLKNPMFTASGCPYTRADQDICEYYEPKKEVSGEDWCNDCTHFVLGQEIIGICKCKLKQKLSRRDE